MQNIYTVSIQSGRHVFLPSHRKCAFLSILFALQEDQMHRVEKGFAIAIYNEEYRGKQLDLFLQFTVIQQFLERLQFVVEDNSTDVSSLEVSNK